MLGINHSRDVKENPSNCDLCSCIQALLLLFIKTSVFSLLFYITPLLPLFLPSVTSFGIFLR